MNKAEKNSITLGRMKWFWCVPAALMYTVTQIPFGRPVAFALCLIFGAAFYLICSRASNYIICEDIINDMREALEKLGHSDSIFEIKSFNSGLVVRVYLIRARQKADMCNMAIIKGLEKGWYKKHLWMTQIVDLADAEEVTEARSKLNLALLDRIKDDRPKANKKSDNSNKEKKDENE